MTDKTGGPAFPRVVEDNGKPMEVCYGMDLRDYFAAKVMQGILSDPDVNPHTDDDFDRLAKGAYKVADHMLKERMK